MKVETKEKIKKQTKLIKDEAKEYFNEIAIPFIKRKTRIKMKRKMVSYKRKKAETSKKLSRRIKMMNLGNNPKAELESITMIHNGGYITIAETDNGLKNIEKSVIIAPKKNFTFSAYDMVQLIVQKINKHTFEKHIRDTIEAINRIDVENSLYEKNNAEKFLAIKIEGVFRSYFKNNKALEQAINGAKALGKKAISIINTKPLEDEIKLIFHYSDSDLDANYSIPICNQRLFVQPIG